MDKEATTSNPAIEGHPRCIKCEGYVRCTVRTEDLEDYYHFPRGAVMDGGGNFGSALYDSFFDGVAIQLLICDDCLRAHKNLYREIKIKPGIEKMKEEGIIQEVPPEERPKHKGNADEKPQKDG